MSCSVNKMKKKPILLAPVGNWEMLRTAVEAGTDEVYLGIKGINMRDRAVNFEIAELKKVVEFCHGKNVKVNLTLNTIIFNDELNKIQEILIHAKEIGIDGIICWDMAVIAMAHRYSLQVHLSTQASVSNIEAINQYKNQSVKRFILARECSLEQIKELVKKSKKIDKNIEIELFIHGAMCVAISGRCFLSQHLYGNETSANRGKCIQPCRRSYIIKDPETDKELEVFNNYVMSPKDLCTLPFIEKILDSGVEVLKIEGRARSPEYVKKVVEVYRTAIDTYYEKKKLSKIFKNKLVKKLRTVYNRDFSSGFYLGKPIDEWTNDYGSKATKKKVYIGQIINFYNKLNVAEVKIETKQLKLKDNILVIGPTTGVIEQKLKTMHGENKKTMKIAKKGDVVGIQLDKKARKNDKVFVFN